MTFNTIFIIGATVSGKSATAIKLAGELDGVIINADSMQVYNGVDVITASPSTEELSQASHRMYGVLSPKKVFDVVQWRDMAVVEVKKALANNKVPILCGGTGFYASAFMKGLSPIPNISSTIREKVRKLQNELSLEEFYNLLLSEDLVMAEKLKIKDPQRIGRALEIIRSTGNSLARYQDLPPVLIDDDIKPMLVAVMPDRQKIYNNINKRFDTMMDDGGLSEVQKLIDLGVSKNSQIGRAIGVRELWDYLEGNLDKESAIENAKTASRQYAKRQLTYIRNQFDADVVIENGDGIDGVTEIFEKQKFYN